MTVSTLNELYIPSLPSLKTRKRTADGFGEKVTASYQRIVFISVWGSVSKDIPETARIMGWTEKQTEDYLEAIKKLIEDRKNEHS